MVRIMDYIITYSKRKSIAIYVHKDGSVEVRCPVGTSKKYIDDIIIKKANWINKSKNKILQSTSRIFNEEERDAFIKKAKILIPNRVKYFSEIMGVYPTSVKIGNAKSYWGCCSRKNGVIFSWRLMQASDEIIDYVVVHELAHIKEHNHSKKFWKEVEKVLGDYKARIAELNKL